VDKPIGPRIRLACCAYLTAALVSSLVVEAAYWNVFWNDPWRTPRWAPYFMLWWDVRSALQPILAILVLSGIPLAIWCPSSQWRWAVLIAFVASLAALNHCFTLP
jgi:hypothetical protein